MSAWRGYQVSYLLFWEHIDDIVGSLLSVVLDGVEFCVIVRSIVLTTTPHDVEETLCYSEFDPVEAHVRGFGGFWNHELVDETMRCGVVSGNGCLGLFVAHFFKGDVKGYRGFAVVEQGCKFGFGGRGHDVFND